MNDIYPEVKLPSAIKMMDGTHEVADLSEDMISKLVGIALNNSTGIVSALEQSIATEHSLGLLQDEGYRLMLAKDGQINYIDWR